jgi:hypothetical protein
MAYIERLYKAGLQLREKFPSTVSHECVQHDHFCPVLKGAANCICQPDILVLCEGQRFEVDRDGNLIPPRPGLVCGHGFEFRKK